MFARKYGMNNPGWTGAFDNEYSDGDFFRIGDLTAQVMRLPTAHMPEAVGFMVGRNVFAGDVEHVHQPQQWSNDLPDTDSAQQDQQASTARLLRLSPDYRLYKGHEEIPPFPPSYSAEDTVKLTPCFTVEELRAKRGLDFPKRPDRVDTVRPRSRGILGRSPRKATFHAGVTNRA